MLTESASQIADFSLLMQRNFSQVDVLGIYPSAAKYTFLSFLANAQALEVPILPITWQSAQNPLKIGGTSKIAVAQANSSNNVVFKCVKESEKREKTKSEIFQMLTTELVVLSHERIRAHENIVQLQGICWDISSDNIPWPVLVFWKADLGDLSDFMTSQEGKALSIHQHAELGFDVCDAIVDMHSINIVHGDLKPENVLVYKYPGDSKHPNGKYTAKVTDFGYSTRYADDKHLISMPISRPWNAPEHTRPNRKWTPEEAKRSDLFSAGLLFLWLLFKQPISRASALAKGEYLENSRDHSWSDEERSRENTSATLLKYKNDKALPALARKLLDAEEKLQDNEKSNLEDFFNSVLNNNPYERDALSTQLPTLDRHKRIEPTASEVDFKIEHSVTEFYNCDCRVRSYIIRSLEDSLRLAKVEGHETTARKVAYQVALCYQIGFGVERNEARSNELLKEFEYPELEFSLLKARDPKDPEDSYEWLALQHWPNEGFLEKQNIEKAISQLSQEARDLSLALGNDHTLTMNVKSQLAYLLGGQGRFDEVEKVSQEIMDMSLNKLSPDSLHILGCMNNLGVIYNQDGRLDEAEKIMTRTIDTLEKIQGHAETLRHQNNPYAFTSMTNLATIYRDQERWPEAEMLHKKAFDISSAILGADHPQTLFGMVNIAATYVHWRRLDEAEELYLEVLNSPSAVLSAQHPFRLRVEGELAYVYSGQGHHKKAVQLGMQTLDARLKILGLVHDDTLVSMGHMTSTFRKCKQWEQAKEMCMQLIERRKETLGAEHAITLEAMVELIKIYFDQERWTEAEILALQVVNARRKLLGPERIATVNAISDLAEIYVKQGRWKEAEDLYMHVLETRKRLLGIHHHNTLACMSGLVVLYVSCGEERLADAEQLALYIMETSVRIHGSSHEDTLTSMGNLATVYQKQGRQDEGLNLMESMKQLGSKADHPDTLLSEHIPQAQKTSQDDDPLSSESTSSFRPRFTPYQSNTLEHIKRRRHDLRRKEKGLPLTPLQVSNGARLH